MTSLSTACRGAWVIMPRVTACRGAWGVGRGQAWGGAHHHTYERMMFLFYHNYLCSCCYPTITTYALAVILP